MTRTMDQALHAAHCGRADMKDLDAALRHALREAAQIAIDAARRYTNDGAINMAIAATGIAEQILAELDKIQ